MRDTDLSFKGYEKLGHHMTTQNTIKHGEWYCIYCGEPGKPVLPPSGVCDRSMGPQYANSDILESFGVMA